MASRLKPAEHTAQLPSSSTQGFFQTRPVIQNAAEEDVVFKRTAALFLPPFISSRVWPTLSAFGDLVRNPTVLRHLLSSERDLPSLQTWDSFGKRADILRTSEGWRALQDIGIAEGIVGIAYEGEFAEHARLIQFLKYHLWSGNSATVTCPSAMTDGAACLLQRQLAAGELRTPQASVFRAAYDALTSRDPSKAWTAGQWMTERAGGSDVRGTETRAEPVNQQGLQDSADFVASDGNELGPWKITGFKWFSSATDADCAVLLAKTGPGRDEISAFFAPMRKRLRGSSVDLTTGKLDLPFNGVYPQRLKNKLGTKALPTAELVLDDMRGYIIGKPGEGTKQISAILNITRIHNAISAVGAWGKALAVSRAFARVRKTSGRLLVDTPAHVKSLADLHVEYKANVMLAFFVVSLLGSSEHAERTKQPLQEGSACQRVGVASQAQANALLRLLTPVTKALTALATVAGVRACMESMGGLGYLENEDAELNVARIFRDVNVLAIWEGTTDVMAADTIRVLRGRDGSTTLAAFEAWVETASSQQSGAFNDGIEAQLQSLKELLKSGNVPELLYKGRRVMELIGWITCTVLLGLDAARDGDKVSAEICRRWTSKISYFAADPQVLDCSTWEQQAAFDRQIVFGTSDSSTSSRL